jgi:hypothetical protein
MWQQLLEEFEVTFAVENDHWDSMWGIRRADNTRKVLGDDVAQQSGLACPGHAQHDSLHDANAIGPMPRLAVDVIAKND